MYLLLSMSIVKCEMFDFIEISVNCEELRPCSLFPIHKFNNRPLSNVKLKLPDNDARDRGRPGA